MRVLKIILIVIGVLLLVGIVMGLTGPKSYVVERSAVIAASPDVVWPYTSSMKTFNEWSPWMKSDTTTVVEYFGTEGTVGSGYKWNSKKNGRGEQTIIELEPGRSSKAQLKFFMPWGPIESESYMNLEPDPAGTKLTWGIRGENDFMGRMMGTMMSMEKGVGPHFEKGLADLQAMVAERSAAVPASGYRIGAVDYPGGKYLAIRGDVKMSDITAFYGKNLPAVMTEVQKAGAQMDGMPTGLYYTWDEAAGMTNMAAGIPVKGDINPPAGMEIITLGPSRSLVLKYMGGYNGLEQAHLAMDDYMKANNLENQPPVIEEYITDPGTEPDSNKWVTKITYLVK